MTQPTFDVKALLRSRREFLLNSVTGLGGMALLSLLGEEAARAAQQQTPPVAAATGPLAPKKAHLPAKAKSCIFLLMESLLGMWQALSARGTLTLMKFRHSHKGICG